MHEETLRQRILDELVAIYEGKEAQAGAEQMRRIEKQGRICVLDDLGKDHLSTMDHPAPRYPSCVATPRRTPSRNTSASLRTVPAMLDAIKPTRPVPVPAAVRRN